MRFAGQRHVLRRQNGRGAVPDRVREIPGQHAVHQPARRRPGNRRPVLVRLVAGPPPPMFQQRHGPPVQPAQV